MTPYSVGGAGAGRRQTKFGRLDSIRSTRTGRRQCGFPNFSRSPPPTTTTIVSGETKEFLIAFNTPSKTEISRLI